MRLLLSTVLNFFRDCIENPLAHTPVDGMARAADAATGTKVANELFFQGAASLDEKGCDRSSRVTPHLRALGILIPQPTCDLLRRPVLLEFTRYDPLQPWAPGEHTGLGSAC